MKTVMKKLLSLALVAVLLLSAVPFQASATETDNQDPAPVTGVQTDADGDKKPAEHVHDFSVKDFTVAPTCEEKGYTIYKCSDETCNETEPRDYVDELKHSFGAWSLLKAATAEEKGQEVRACLREGCSKKEYQDVDYVAPKADTNKKTVTFVASGNTIDSIDMEVYKAAPTLPTAPVVKNYKFAGWFSEEQGKGKELKAGLEYTGQFTTYYAYYIESADDGISTLSVSVRFYVGGVQQGSARLLYTQDFNNGENMLKWLMNNEAKTSKAIFSIVSADDYEWTPRNYYNYEGKELLTEQTLTADGDKAVVVKVYGKKATEANVLLYVHTYDSNNKVYVTQNIYEMNGYTKGSTVNKSAVETLIKKHYTGSNMTLQGLYTDAAWEQLLNGENPTAANGVTVSGSPLKIHVILKNATATSGSTSKADSTNPKTGDMIFVPVMVMFASAAAVAYVYMGSKKRAH